MWRLDIEEDCDWRLLGSRARIRSSQGVICWAYKIMDHGSITLLLMARGHTASLGSQISLHYGEACPPAIYLSVSQLRTLLKNTRHITHQISNKTLEFSQRQGIHQYQRHTPSRRDHHSSIINQSIDQ